MMTPALLRVMYAPLDYIHPHYFSANVGDMQPALRSVVNHALIRQFKLETAIDFRLQPGDFSQVLVSQWESIPAVAWLLGCKLARGSLALNGRLAKLPGLARQFIELPLACAPLELAGNLTTERLRMHGAQALFPLQQQLPTALAQRLDLMFAPSDVIADKSMPLNRALITFAFDYAKNYKH